MSLNRWVFKWRLKVSMLSHSRMSAGREFQVDGAATEKCNGPVRCVCEERRASEECRVRGGAWVAEIRWSGCVIFILTAVVGPPG